VAIAAVNPQTPDVNWPVTYEERSSVEKIQAKKARKKIEPKMLTFAIVFVLRWKICMGSPPPRLPAAEDIRPPARVQGTL
jgi:hypothetical protein